MNMLEAQVLKATRTLARINPLTPAIVTDCGDVKLLAAWSQKRTIKAIVAAANSFRIERQFGKLRSALLLGVTLFDDEFLVQAERAGVLLGDSMLDKGFTRVYDELAHETARDERWRVLGDRVRTYAAYQQLLNEMSQRGNVSRFIRFRPRRLVKMALAVTALSFLTKYFQVPIYSLSAAETNKVSGGSLRSLSM
jgi:hypothetical protein